VLFFIAIFFNDLFMKILIKIGVATKKEDDEVDEQLGTYFQCLSKFQRRVWYLEEKHLQKAHGIYTLSDEAMEQLRTV
jgi:hypothetical protein